MTTLKDWIIRFEKMALATTKRGTYQLYCRSLELFLEDFPKLKRVEDITRLHWPEWERKLLARGYKPSGVQARRRAMVSFFYWLIALGVVTVNPFVRPKHHSIGSWLERYLQSQPPKESDR